MSLLLPTQKIFWGCSQKPSELESLYWFSWNWYFWNPFIPNPRNNNNKKPFCLCIDLELDVFQTSLCCFPMDREFHFLVCLRQTMTFSLAFSFARQTDAPEALKCSAITAARSQKTQKNWLELSMGVGENSHSAGRRKDTAANLGINVCAWNGCSHIQLIELRQEVFWVLFIHLHTWIRLKFCDIWS